MIYVAVKNVKAAHHCIKQENENVKSWTRTDIQAMQQRYRAMFINSLSGYKSANLVGTTDTNGNENLCIVSSVFHIGADPALMGMITRPQSVRRDTVANIKATDYYTLNHVNTDMVVAAHQTSARYEADISEFAETGLTAHYEPDFLAPFVAESRVRIGLKLVETRLLEINQTELIIGEVVLVQSEEFALEPDGSIDIEQLNSVAISGLDRYHSTQKLTRLSYAKPDSKPQELYFDAKPFTSEE